MRTVAVTGAAGLLGQRVLALLAADQGVERVVAVDRVPMPAPAPKVRTEVLDLAGSTASENLTAMVAGVDTVIHLAWAASASNGSNLAALGAVLAASARVEADRLVHLSSATVYGAWSDNPVPLREDDLLRPNPELRYAGEKAEAERRIADWAANHQRCAVAVLRPVATLGTWERPLYWALTGISRPSTKRESSSGRMVQFVHAEDLASAVVHIGRAALTGIYNVAPDEGVSDETARALAGGLARLTLPPRLGRWVARWGWTLARRGAPREVDAYGEHSWVVAVERLRDSGWQPLFTSEEALVAADDRAHWDDLPAGHRHAILVLAVGMGACLAGAASWMTWRSWIVPALSRKAPESAGFRG